VRFGLNHDIVNKKFEIEVGAGISSYTLSLVLWPLRLTGFHDVLPEGFSISFEHGDEVYLNYAYTVRNYEKPPEITHYFKEVLNAEKYFKEIVNRELEEYMNTPLKNYWKKFEKSKCKSKMTVKDFLKALNWNPKDPLDVVTVKLIAAKAELVRLKFTCLFHILLAQAILEGHSEATLNSKVGNGVETLIHFIEGKRLVVKEQTVSGRKYPAIFLDGKPLNMSLHMLPRFRRLLRLARSLINTSIGEKQETQQRVNVGV